MLRARGEHPVEVLSCVPDVLADNLGEVDRPQVEAAARRRASPAAIVLPVPDGPANSALDAQPGAERASKPPPVDHSIAVHDACGELLELDARLVGQHDLVPAEGRLDLARQLGELRTGAPARAAA